MFCLEHVTPLRDLFSLRVGRHKLGSLWSTKTSFFENHKSKLTSNQMTDDSQSKREIKIPLNFDASRVSQLHCCWPFDGKRRYWHLYHGFVQRTVVQSSYNNRSSHKTTTIQTKRLDSKNTSQKTSSYLPILNETKMLSNIVSRAIPAKIAQKSVLPSVAAAGSRLFGSVPDEKEKVIIMGAAGRDFHDFITYWSKKPNAEVKAFTGQQIPGIDHRTFPAELCNNVSEY